MAMTTEHLDVLRVVGPELINRIDIEGGLLAQLFANSVINENHMDTINKKVC